MAHGFGKLRPKNPGSTDVETEADVYRKRDRTPGYLESLGDILKEKMKRRGKRMPKWRLKREDEEETL